YEVGLKSEWLDHRLRLNLAAFYANYNDIQVQTENVGPAGNYVQTTNAGSGRLYGGEAEVKARLGDLTLGANVALLNAKYTEGPGVGTPFDQAPKVTSAANATYKIPFAIGDLDLHADYDY